MSFIWHQQKYPNGTQHCLLYTPHLLSHFADLVLCSFFLQGLSVFQIDLGGNFIEWLHDICSCLVTTQSFISKTVCFWFCPISCMIFSLVVLLSGNQHVIPFMGVVSLSLNSNFLMRLEFHRDDRLIPMDGTVCLLGNRAAAVQNTMWWHAKCSALTW